MNSGQIFKLKEQVESQNKTIAKLHDLIKSLDQERDYYKQQIAVLKEQVDHLTAKVQLNFSHNDSDWKIAIIKQEVMEEIQKVKSMLQAFTQGARLPYLPHSSYLEDKKESFVTSLDLIRDELSFMNKRIDRMEAGQSSELSRTPYNLAKKYTSQLSNNHHLFSPSCTDTSSLELHKLRLSINSMNSKLDNLEKKLEEPLTSSSISKKSYQKTLSAGHNAYDLDSLSELSSMGSSDDDDDDVDEFPQRSKFCKTKEKRSFISKQRARLHSELSYLDLSDEDDLDTDYLDLKI